jgi:hypothetical protein
MGGTQHISQAMWLGIAMLMLIPILMVVLSLVLPQPVNRWVNIIAAAFFFLFNLVTLPTYPSAYDKFLLAVSLVFNGVTVWTAWNWA